MRLYRAGARGAAAAARMRAGRTARRVLVAEAAVVGGLALALFVREIPGIRREVRIWRMINVRSGAKRPH